MEGFSVNLTRLITCLAVLLAVVPSFGCIGLSAQILNVLVGQRVKAQYDGLKKQRVAVVVTSSFGVDGPDYSMELLSRLIMGRLKQNVKEIELVSTSEIGNVMDSQGYDANYVEIGETLKADKVIVVEVSSYSLREGATLYKGRAMYSTRVYDIETGEVRFNRGPIDIAYPESGQPVTDTNANQFEKTFLNEVSYRIARYFHDYAIEEEFGRDAILSN
jgi:hypothetical protein